MAAELCRTCGVAHAGPTHMYTYVNDDEINANMKDPITLEPLLDAVELPCEHVFSRATIAPWLAQSHQCPLKCHGDVDERSLRPVGKVFRNLLDSLPVVCPFGCEAQAPRGELFSHLLHCSRKPPTFTPGSTPLSPDSDRITSPSPFSAPDLRTPPPRPTPPAAQAHQQLQTQTQTQAQAQAQTRPHPQLHFPPFARIPIPITDTGEERGRIQTAPAAAPAAALPPPPPPAATTTENRRPARPALPSRPGTTSPSQRTLSPQPPTSPTPAPPLPPRSPAVVAELHRLAERARQFEARAGQVADGSAATRTGTAVGTAAPRTRAHTMPTPPPPTPPRYNRLTPTRPAPSPRLTPARTPQAARPAARRQRQNAQHEDDCVIS